MEVVLPSSIQSVGSLSALQKPYDLLAHFFESAQFEWMVFTLDLDRNLIYLSESAWEISKIDFKRWQGQRIDSLLTNHVWNEDFKSDLDIALRQDHIQKVFCEIWNDEGSAVQLEVHRRMITNQGTPIGIVGIARQIEGTQTQADLSVPSSTASSTHPFKCLTPGELSVIELVIDGELNKSIAAKLGIAMRTVEMRRSKAMQKLKVKSLSEMVKLWCQYTHETLQRRQ
jgi:DNA-binding CsgD family transcriptional regulator